jgi:hypothetical protein
MANRRKFITGVVAASTMTIAGCSGGQDTTGEPEFEVREVRSSPSIAQSGEEITAAATISNVGEGSGTASVEFSLDVTQSSVETESINPGDVTQITTDIEVPLADSERYDLTATLDEQTSLSTPVDIYEELSQNGLYGSVVSAADMSLEGSNIRIISISGEFADNDVAVDDVERFFSPHIKSVSYTLQATFSAGANAPEFDKIPDISPLQDEYSVTNDVEVLEQYEIPEGYRTEIKLVDSDGNPVTDIPFVSVRDQIGNGERYTLNEDGYLIHPERSESGVILPSDSTFNVDARPGRDNRPVAFGEVSGSPDDEEFVFEVSEPSQFSSS